MSNAEDDLSHRVYDTLTDAGDDASPAEARNGVRHVISLSLTKVADGLLSPKLVLAYLMNAIGGPAVLVSLLVPVREAGALLPQILLAGRVEAMRHRKWVWAIGSLIQGVAALGIALSALLLEGWTGGLAIVGFLAILATARAACSVSYKDILGKTVAKTRRGAVTGTAGSVASAAVLVFAILLLTGLVPQDVIPLVIALCVAAAAWLGAGFLFMSLEEEASETDGSRPPIDWSPLREDKGLRRFIAARGFLTATALAPPYIVLLDSGDGRLQALGALLLASSAAAFLSSYVWGRLSDVSSRRVLILSGILGAASMAAGVVLALLGFAELAWTMPLVLFVMQIAYNGVRQGRSTYLVDMSPEDRRSTYAALSNTAIGVLLLVAGALGGALSAIGPLWALGGFAVLSLIGAVVALGLDEVERTD